MPSAVLDARSIAPVTGLNTNPAIPFIVPFKKPPTPPY